MSKKVHNFTETKLSDSAFADGGKYHRTIYCTRCGIVAWYYNNPDNENAKLQEKIRVIECI